MAKKLYRRRRALRRRAYKQYQAQKGLTEPRYDEQAKCTRPDFLEEATGGAKHYEEDAWNKIISKLYSKLFTGGRENIKEMLNS